ncbi:MAG: hypothetical protein KGQ86_10850 [Bacteroidetes bacterium]|nr:hypothetical protein [Bacteroidota bacterium]
MLIHFLFWGFYAHRLLNNLAIYALPSAMISFYQQEEVFITEHAVDPDKRRYASPFEAARHYIDFEKYGSAPYDSLPSTYTDAIFKYHTMYLIQQTDTIYYKKEQQEMPGYRELFRHLIAPKLPDGEWKMPGDSLFSLLPPHLERDGTFFFSDDLNGHGILPWHLFRMQRRLTDAFIKKDKSRILQLSAEIGHYIGDAHVPLHTTQNYNGQLTEQTGIHALWESHIPEYFAASTYQLWTGKATYWENPEVIFWEICKESQRLVSDVLTIEKQVRETFPPDKQWCFVVQGKGTIKKPCIEFSRAYQTAMNGMVEKQMKKTIQAIASSWYTAWVDAGQPILEKIDVKTTKKRKLEKQIKY